MDDTLTASIGALLEPVLEDQNRELVELTCSSQGGVFVIRVLVDQPGGVTIQDCTRINQHLAQVLEASGLLDLSYTLEVASPGLDRPLVSHRDYERAVGEDLLLSIRTEQGRLRESEGQLLAVQPEAIVLKTSSGNVTISLREIHSATKVIRF